MIRVVLDTNVVVSAALTPTGAGFGLLAMAAAGRIRMHVSPAILDEYREVLLRPEVRVSAARAKTLLRWIMRLGRLVHPARTVRVSPDPDDNMFLECAHAAKAHFLVTSNIKDFPKSWKYTTTIQPRVLLLLLLDLEPPPRGKKPR